jgi:hypothetical protein
MTDLPSEACSHDGRGEQPIEPFEPHPAPRAGEPTERDLQRDVIAAGREIADRTSPHAVKRPTHPAAPAAETFGGDPNHAS